MDGVAGTPRGCRGGGGRGPSRADGKVGCGAVAPAQPRGAWLALLGASWLVREPHPSTGRLPVRTVRAGADEELPPSACPSRRLAAAPSAASTCSGGAPGGDGGRVLPALRGSAPVPLVRALGELDEEEEEEEDQRAVGRRAHQGCGDESRLPPPPLLLPRLEVRRCPWVAGGLLCTSTCGGAAGCSRRGEACGVAALLPPCGTRRVKLAAAVAVGVGGLLLACSWRRGWSAWCGCG